VVDRGGLENRCTFTGTVGSNPTLSAIKLFQISNFKFEISQRRGRLMVWHRVGSAAGRKACEGSSPSLSAIYGKKKEVEDESPSTSLFYRLHELSGSGLCAILTERTPPGSEDSNGSPVRMCRSSHRGLTHFQPPYFY
jgi:hypothetical protein